MIIPLRTNRTPRRRPLVTEVLIIVNMLVYLAGLAAESAGLFDRAAMVDFGALYGRDFHFWQVVTYQFLHDPRSIWHLAFNLLFLWVFGSAVEDRLGRLSFLAFYLMGGIVAGLAHMSLTPDSPVIGASGAVAGVTGGFLALFPRSRILILFFFFIIGVYSIPAIWFIALYFVIDILRATADLFGAAQGVAYAAHIAGYLYGFALAFTLLALGIVKREEFDIFFLLKQARRRAEFRSASRGSAAGGLWESASSDTGKELQRRREKQKATESIDAEQLAIRGEIGRLIAAHELEQAAAKYVELLERNPESVLAEQLQLDMANQLHTQDDETNSAKAYELLLKTYPRSHHAPQVRLMLAIHYLRRLNQPQRAKQLIEQAKARLADPAERALADSLLAEIG